jgi:DNA repair protein RecN (Recombination protein N)
MITSLSIKNYALIEKLAIDFSSDFSVITGETGAGKSILLGALGLVLGKRADLAALKNKEEKCIIEAHFDIKAYDLKDFFDANDLEYDAQTIIRREILPSGKTRAFVNDSPVNLQELQELGLFLIDIHSQHQTQELSDANVQFEIIDAIAGNKQMLLDYQLLLKQYKADVLLLQNLEQQQATALKEQEYNSFLLNELVLAQIKLGEQALLESEFEQLNNVALIGEAISKAIALSSEEHIGVVANLKDIKVALQKIASFGTVYQELFDRLNSVLIEFEDINDELNRCNEKIINDPERLDFVSKKLQTLFDLQKKHQVQTEVELLDIQTDLENKLSILENSTEQIGTLKKAIALKTTELNTLAAKIHQNRKTNIPVLSEKLVAILSPLGMPNASFKIEINATNQYLQNGKDEINFLFSANKGSDFGPLKKVASGGEMSRIMLAIKAILAQYSKLPTLIFDEIDTGVSGEIALKMADIMKNMSKTMQLFAITHLPQIAAKGAVHYCVSKSTVGNETFSEIKKLDEQARIIEIAKMLSGNTLSDSAINHAKALMH